MKTPYSQWEHNRRREARRQALLRAAIAWAAIILSGLIGALAIYGLLCLAGTAL